MKNLVQMNPLFFLLIYFLYLQACRAECSFSYVIDSITYKSWEVPIIYVNSTAENITTVSSNQINALHQLYNSAHGENWNWRAIGKMWNFTKEPVNPCDGWQGVTCCNIGNSTEGAIISLTLSQFNLEGTLPNQWQQLPYLFNLDISINNLTGAVPKSLTLLSNMSSINMARNRLNGTIPQSFLQNFQKMFFISFAYNALEGRLPNFPRINELQYFDVLHNKMYGKLPSSIVYLTSLRRLYLGNNLFTGHLTNITKLTKLDRLSVNTNSFTGPFPEDFGNLVDLQYAYMHDNQLTGTMPSGISNCTKLFYWTFYVNNMGGSLPSSIQSLNKMQNLIFDENYFTSTLPDVFYDWKSLRQLIVYANTFTGTLPPSLATLSAVQVLLLQANLFTGSPAPAFNASVQTSLQSLDLSSNSFTGELPGEIFGPSLISFTAFRTCFSGTLSTKICQATTLEILDLDGMTSGCSSLIWPAIPSSPKISDSIHGGIPDCIWALPNITQLRLSGNGLTGTIPPLPHYGNLSDLDLSFNSMKGSIPEALQSSRTLLTLNLQNNRFTGGIQGMRSLNYADNDYSTGVNLKLSMNRLSGTIPMPLLHAYHINIVNGNLFSCSAHHQPPYQDPNSTEYVCASNLLDISLYAFIGCGIIVAVFLLCLLRVALYIYGQKYDYRHNVRFADIWRVNNDPKGLQAILVRLTQEKKELHRKTFSSVAAGHESAFSESGGVESGAPSTLSRITFKTNVTGESFSPENYSLLLKLFMVQILLWHSKVTQLLEYEKETELIHLVQFLKSLKILRQITIIVMLFAVCIGTPLFAVLKDYYATYQMQYRWELSGAFLSGYMPAIFVGLLWLLALSFSLHALRTNIPRRVYYSAAQMMKRLEEGEEGEEDEEPDESTAASMMNYVRNSLNRLTLTGPPPRPTVNTAPVDVSKAAISRSNSGNTGSASVSWRTYNDSDRKTTFSGNSRRFTIARITTAAVSAVKEKQNWISLTLLLTNAAFVVAFKTACIYLLVTSKSPFTIKVLLEMSLSSIDIIWGSIALPYIISNLPGSQSAGRMFFKTFLLFFNSSIAPILIIAVADTACFNGLFFPTASVSESFTFSSCIVYSAADSSVCEQYTYWTTQSDFTPGFVYNYNCYSTVLISFIPIFLISYIALTLFIPCGSIFLLSRKERWWILDYFPGVYFLDNANNMENLATTSMKNRQDELFDIIAQENSRNNNTNNINIEEEQEKRLSRSSKALFHSTSHLHIDETEEKELESASGRRSPNKALPTVSTFPDPLASSHHQQGAVMTSVDTVDSANPITRDFKDINNNDDSKQRKRIILFPAFILASSVHHLMVLLTFGLMCPSLAVAIALVTTTTSLTWEVLIGRWMMRDHKLIGNLDERFAGPYTTKLDELCIFYALMLMDMTGDEIGWNPAYCDLGLNRTREETSKEEISSTMNSVGESVDRIKNPMHSVDQVRDEEWLAEVVGGNRDSSIQLVSKGGSRKASLEIETSENY
eukprot:gene4447-4767_t